MQKHCANSRWCPMTCGEVLILWVNKSSKDARSAGNFCKNDDFAWGNVFEMYVFCVQNILKTNEKRNAFCVLRSFCVCLPPTLSMFMFITTFKVGGRTVGFFWAAKKITTHQALWRIWNLNLHWILLKNAWFFVCTLARKRARGLMGWDFYCGPRS